jgi:hypothetical protein
MKVEEWRPLPWLGFGFDYEVSSFGRVRSWLGNGGIHAGKRQPQPRLLSGHKKKAYRYVRLGGKINGKDYPIHRLVLTAFVGPPSEPWFEAAHGDGNGDNNRLDNLAWKEHASNLNDRSHVGNRYGTHPKKNSYLKDDPI